MSNPVRTPASEQAKAIIGAILAGLTAFGTALADGSVTPVEIVGIAIAVLATYGSVYGVTNKRTTRRTVPSTAAPPTYGSS